MALQGKQVSLIQHLLLCLLATRWSYKHCTRCTKQTFSSKQPSPHVGYSPYLQCCNVLMFMGIKMINYQQSAQSHLCYQVAQWQVKKKTVIHCTWRQGLFGPHMQSDRAVYSTHYLTDGGDIHSAPVFQQHDTLCKVMNTHVNVVFVDCVIEVVF